jgi:hypothetical protein
MYHSLQNIDHTALKVNQLTIIALVVLAFIVSWPVLVGIVALLMLLGALLGFPGFLPVYRYLLKPLGLARPQILLDNPEPHRFAQGLGGVFLAAAAAVLYLGASWLGWGLAAMVAFLAALNAFGGFCLGCFLYYWLGRIGLPGFRKQPPAGTFPGRAPLTSAGERKQAR